MENIPVMDNASGAGDGKNTKKAPKGSVKKHRSANILRVALYMLRRKPNRKSAGSVPVQAVASGSRKGFWKNLMTAVRPLGIQDQPRLALLPPPPPPPPAMEAFHDSFEPQSPLHVRCSTLASCSVDPMSRYCSAEDLKQLGGGSDDDDGDGEDGRDDVVRGDETIDLLAEEFIARFYEQIKLQRLEESVSDRFNRSEVEEITPRTTAD
ncbi:hypothetical protein H6P81_004083 [Aristolochia fimbriata]|uniref:Uncharacterized protein n=1 Tax=Aristolochia fimbriata TaxID=158543 RepID=A0AAV7FEE0_ARIFI|nr:hypothetical protein H6P81_004083 [Aristolochia fimbriata]